MPDLTPIQVQILTPAPALGPVEVEQFITFPIEAAVSGLPGLHQLRSISRYGLSAEVREGSALRLGAATHMGEGETVIGMVQMLAGENAQRVVSDVKTRLRDIQSSLPPGGRRGRERPQLTSAPRQIHGA